VISLNNYKIKVHYLYHSGFAVETKEHFLIFDYYKDNFQGKERTLENGVISKDLIKNKKNVFVFSSHSHADHFNPIILKWSTYNKNIKYILSSDIKLKRPVQNYYKLSKYENINLGSVYIKAFGSTDIGISFLVKVDDITLFHAGDLNWWHWKEDSLQDQKDAEANFKYEISKLKGEKIDIAFFPVDPRLEEYYLKGGKYFIKEINPSIFFPMHLWDKMSTTDNFKDAMKDYSTKIMTIHKNGETFLIDSSQL
jgi:L-ascorbate metabolism protein UlaG (beta-lactamase superfamily)